MTLTDLRRRRQLGLVVSSVVVVGLTAIAVLDRGAASPASVLLVLPGCLLAIVASRRELLAGLLLTAACCFLPAVLTPSVDATALVRAATLAAVVAAVASVVRLLDQESRRVSVVAGRAASHDPLTGLLNRRGWQDALEREHARTVRSGVGATVVALDLDGLKRVNSERGQAGGDQLLRATAERLRRTLRTEDLLARVGGDEFALLLVGADVDQAIASTERLRASGPATSAFSAGVAAVREGEHPSVTLARAEQALYRAKATGGGISLPVQPWQAEHPDPDPDSDLDSDPDPDSGLAEPPADGGPVDLSGTEHGRGMVGA